MTFVVSDRLFERVVLCDLSVKARKLGELETTGTRVLGARKGFLSMIGVQHLQMLSCTTYSGKLIVTCGDEFG